MFCSDVLAPGIRVSCKVPGSFSCKKKDENSLRNSISDYLPFLCDNAFYPLVHSKNSFIPYIYWYGFRVLFTCVENDSKSSRVMASSKAS